MKKVRVAIIITSLGMGGAERYLFKTLKHLNRKLIEPMVLNIGPPDFFSEKISSLGIHVVSTGVQTPLQFISKWPSAVKVIYNFKPDIIHAWMYHAMAWSLPMKILLNRPIIWSIRNGIIDSGKLPKSTEYLAKGLGRLSFMCEQLIYNSRLSQDHHHSFGYQKEKSIVIKNGFEAQDLSLQHNISKVIRQKLYIDSTEPLIAFVSRHHPQKDISCFIRTILALKESHPNPFKIISIGQGLGSQNHIWVKQLKENRLDHHVIPIGVVDDINEWLPASDILLLTSKEESAPNVIGEAMAWSLPCICTNVGDLSSLLNQQQMANIGDHKKLSQKLSLLMSDKKIREELGQDNHLSIQQHSIKNANELLLQVYGQINS